MPEVLDRVALRVEVDQLLKEIALGPLSPPEPEGPGKLQLALRAVLIGCLLGGILAAVSVSFGLQTGWTIGGSLIAAVLGCSAVTVLQPKQWHSR